MRKGDVSVGLIISVFLIVIVTIVVAKLLGAFSGISQPAEESAVDSFQQLINTISYVQQSTEEKFCASTDSNFRIVKKFYVQTDPDLPNHLLLMKRDEDGDKKIDESTISVILPICCDSELDEGGNCKTSCGDGSEFIFGNQFSDLEGKICVCRSLGRFNIWQESGECKYVV